MNAFKWLFVGLVAGFSGHASAEALDGYIGVSGGIVKHMTPSDQVGGKDSRKSYRLDFVRLQKSVALDLRFGDGLTYQDFGFAFKIFHHIAFSSSTATGISLGAGFGGNYSRAGLAADDKTFYELIAPAFARVMFDFGIGMGLFIDAEYNALFQRRYTEGTNSDNRKIANLYFIGAGLAFSAM